MLSDTLLRRAALTGIYLLPLTAVIFSSELAFPFVTARNLYFRALTELVFCCWIVLAWRSPAYRLQRSPLLLTLAAFTLWIGVADIAGVGSARSFGGSLERMEGYTTTVHLLLYAISAAALLKTPAQWRALFLVNVTVGLAAMVLSLADPTLRTSRVYEWRLEGVLGQAAYLASFMVFNFFFTLLVWVQLKPRLPLTLTCVAVLLLQVAVVIMTATRGAMLGLLAGGGLAAIYAIVTLRPALGTARRAAVPLVAAFLLLLALALGWGADTPALQRLTDYSQATFAREPRPLLWLAALSGIGARPLLGWGQEHFDSVFNRYFQPGLWYAEPWFDRAHNQFLEWGVAAGLPGLLLYAALFLVAAHTLLRRTAASGGEKAITLGLLAACAVHNLFAFDNIVSHLQFLTLLVWLHSRDEHKTPVSMPKLAVAPVLLASAALLLVGTLALMHVPTLRKAHLLQQASTLLNAGAPAQALAAYVEAGRLRGSNQEVADLLVAAATRIQTAPDIDRGVKQSWFESADVLMREHRTAIGDGDARLLAQHSLLLSATERYTEADALLERAALLAPRKQGIRMQLANNALARSDFASAAHHARAAFEVEPAYLQARLLYATTLILDGRTEESDTLLAPVATADGLVDQEQILNAYFATGQQDRVLAILRQRIAANPTEADYKLALGATLRLFGRFEELQALLEEIIRLHPEAGERARRLLSE